MKEWYVLPDGIQEGGHIRLKHTYANIWYVVKVWVWPQSRGCGIGSHLLRTVCYDADLQGVILRLYVAPFRGHLCLNTLQLVDWYGRYGFNSLHRYDKESMERLPSCGRPVFPTSQNFLPVRTSFSP
jgi:GNAT superfamily N-acetyltransferase